jgi:hypothetical protein
MPPNRHDLTTELPFWIINDVEFDIGSFCNGQQPSADEMAMVIRGRHVDIVQV